MNKIIIILFSILITKYSFAATEYLIEHSENDEVFIINGEKYEAQSYCFDMEEDDPVIFLSGSPLGACSSAKILNLRTEKICNVWCE